MKYRLLALRDRLSASYWFIPTVMAVLAVILSILTIELDETVGRELRWVTGLIYVDSPEGARAVLSTVASSMITVAGVVFSLTMVVLSLTSQQYGPLVLAHFMRDRGNQFVLGVFTATFLYCLLILRTIRGVEDAYFIPHISVLVGLGLSIASLAVLIYFIHHVSESIQAPNIIARLSEALNEKIDHLFPEMLGKAVAHPDSAQEAVAMLRRLEVEGTPIKTRESGYLQMIDDEALLKVARQYALVVSLEVLPGQYLFNGQPLVRVLALEPQDSDPSAAIQAAFIFGSQRTHTQDVEFVFMQLSALAVRALSPAINDPFTAMMVINHLGEALRAVLKRQPPSKYRYDDADQLRVIATAANFESLFITAFDPIRHYGHGDPRIDIRLMRVWRALWETADDLSDRQFLERCVAQLYYESRERLTDSEDERLHTAYLDIVRDFEVAQNATRM